MNHRLHYYTRNILSIILAMTVLSGCTGFNKQSQKTIDETMDASTNSIISTGTPSPSSSDTPENTLAATPKPTPAIKVMSVTVDTGKKYQTFIGFGGNYCSGMFNDDVLGSIGKYTLETLRPEYVRVPILLDWWEPVNDNTDPTTINSDGFKLSPRVSDIFNMIQSMKNDYGVTTFTASVWNVAPWMVNAEEGTTGGIIPEENYDEVIESIIAWLLYVKDNCGVEINYFSFNEPDIGVNVLMGADSMKSFVSEAGPLFKKAGLNTKFLIGDVSLPTPTVDYAKKMMSDESIAEYLGPISFHTWNSSTISDNMLSTIRDYSLETGKPLFASEFGYNPGLWKTPEEFLTWQNAWFLANLYYRTIKFSGAGLLEYWELQNDYPLMSIELEPYPAWFITRQMMDTIKPGSIFVDCQSSDESLLGTFSALHEDGNFVIHLLNKTEKPIMAIISGAPGGEWNQMVSVDQHYQEMKNDVVENNGTHSLELPPKSVVTLSSK